MASVEEAWQRWWQIKERDNAAIRERLGPNPTMCELMAGASEEQRLAYQEYWEAEARRSRDLE